MYLFKIIGNKKHKMISKYENSSKITEKIIRVNYPKYEKVNYNLHLCNILYDLCIIIKIVFFFKLMLTNIFQFNFVFHVVF